jgi:hypothetical protein
VTLPEEPLGSLVEELERLLALNKTHQVVALRARLGIDGPRTTLDAAGRLVGMTRERVRQVEERFFAYFLGSPAAEGLVERIERLRVATDGPLFLRQLASKDRWFTGLADESEVLIPLLEVASGSDLHFVTTPVGEVVAPRSMTSWDELMKGSLNAVTKLGDGASRRAVRRSVVAVLKERKAPELLDILLPAVEAKIRYSTSGTLIIFAQTAPVVAKDILEESECPLHYSEVARRLSARTGQPFVAQTALGVLQEARNVYLLGRGTYGLAKHIALRPAAIKRLIADCEAIVTAVAPRKQWHASELLDALRAIGKAPDNADKYLIDACLSRSSVLQSLGRMVWVVRRAWPRTTADRIDLRDAAVQALDRAGRPLRNDELRREIAVVRGVDEYLLIAPDERMARTAPNMWGLLDRDFMLPDLQRKAVSDAIYETALKQDFAVHTSELPEVLVTIAVPEGATLYMIRQIAGRDPRLKLFKGNLIGLREWKDARRPTWREAMVQIASSLQAPVSLDWLHAELERRVHRSLSRIALYRIVSGSGLAVNWNRTRGPHGRYASNRAANIAPAKPV